jgi:hypothetical protein
MAKVYKIRVTKPQMEKIWALGIKLKIKQLRIMAR